FPQRERPRSFPVPVPESLGPAWLLDWARARQRQRIGRNVLCNHRSRPDIGSGTDLDRRHQGAVRADERMRADLRAVFGKAIIIASNRTRTDIRFGADACVSNIAQMVNLRAGTDLGGLHLHEIADMNILSEFGAGTQPCEGADRRILADRCAFQMRKRTDYAAFPDADSGTEDDMRLDDDVAPKHGIKCQG